MESVCNAHAIDALCTCLHSLSISACLCVWSGFNPHFPTTVHHTWRSILKNYIHNCTLTRIAEYKSLFKCSYIYLVSHKIVCMCVWFCRRCRCWWYCRHSNCYDIISVTTVVTVCVWVWKRERAMYVIEQLPLLARTHTHCTKPFFLSRICNL